MHLPFCHFIFSSCISLHYQLLLSVLLCHNKGWGHNNPLFLGYVCKIEATFLTVRWPNLWYRYGLERLKKLKIVEHLPPCILYRASPIIVPVQVEEALQFFVDSIKADTMPVLPSIHRPPGTDTIFVRMSTFVPHFLASSSKLSDLILPIT